MLNPNMMVPCLNPFSIEYVVRSVYWDLYMAAVAKGLRACNLTSPQSLRMVYIHGVGEARKGAYSPPGIPKRDSSLNVHR